MPLQNQARYREIVNNWLYDRQHSNAEALEDAKDLLKVYLEEGGAFDPENDHKIEDQMVKSYLNSQNPNANNYGLLFAIW